MLKYKILGLVNLLLTVFFIYFLTAGMSISQPLSVESFINEYLPYGIFLFLIFVNVFLAYKFLREDKYPLPFYLYLILSFSTVFWFLLIFISSYIASNLTFFVLSITLIFLIFFLLHKPSKKIALTLSLVTLFIFIASIVLGFEESYCWGKSIEADSTGSKMVIATKEEGESLKVFGIKEGGKIGLSFRTERNCHKNFNFISAVKEKYFLTE